jgi:hypothetical protein
MGTDRRRQPGRLDPHRDRRALTARDHQPVESFQVSRDAHLAGLGAEPAQHPGMGLEVPLDSKDTYA